MNTFKYIWENEVRVNETDFQGIVNNANYFIYMTHARNKHLDSVGVNIAKIHEDGFDLVLIRAEVDFKSSLRCGDEFIVTSILKPNGRIRIDFEQEVLRKSDGKLVVHAINTGVCISIATRRPIMPDILKKILFCHV